ncbi:hypothetical protein Z517_04130 [Fonsecaea pedrosoi CBS 271.37]|uniref:Uncharacterized protein n=1 Tax=Fonsecaea pedrosoi CBS 271.37 TaxID=1442368 RepID=A0A0D2F391_9EURO|nr:uncharacterized protein Z517_04130 [Fonsecaea pedrosoi CBS 271.37]KIW81107.1 hypothetical protein Z517_04130 [Fonsecaea pedrosoi CBS 271.37]
MSDIPLRIAAADAAAEGRADELARLLNHRPPTHDELKGLAFLASESKSLPIPQVLLNNSWDINSPESYCDPPFLGGAGADEDVVRWFLVHGADPNAFATKYRVTPLSRAVQYAPLKIVQLLLDFGGSATTGELVWFACQRPAEDPDALTILKLLYNRGAPVDNVLFADFNDLRDVSISTGTPLWVSIGKGDVARVQFLLDRGASLLAKEPGLDLSPLEKARHCVNQEIAKIVSQAATSRSDVPC